jgi:two-component system, cell cycle sensor histidine kinase and response regulator CckA
MAGKTILLVDDEPSVLGLTQISLKRMGYTVLTASDGVEGAALFAKEVDSISILVTDVQMPKMDGLKLAVLARSLNPNLSIIFISGYAPTSGIESAVLDKGTWFVQKPFSIDKLEAAVRESLKVR